MGKAAAAAAAAAGNGDAAADVLPGQDLGRATALACVLPNVAARVSAAGVAQIQRIYH